MSLDFRYRASVTLDGFPEGSLVFSPTPRLDIEVLLSPFIEGAQGDAGPQGPSGGNTSYEFVQSSPSVLWTVNHNLNQKPQVTILSPGGVEIDALVQFTSSNQFLVLFNAPQAGSAQYI